MVLGPPRNVRDDKGILKRLLLQQQQKKTEDDGSDLVDGDDVAMVMGGHGRGLDGGKTDHDVHDDNDCFHGCHC